MLAQPSDKVKEIKDELAVDWLRRLHVHEQNARPRTEGFPVSRKDEILVIRAMASAARKSAEAMKLDFATYLLGMVEVSLSDHIADESSKEQKRRH